MSMKLWPLEPLRPSKNHRSITRLLQQAGTDVARNEQDPFGDGDQRPIMKRVHRDKLREVWANGDELMTCLNERLLSPFGWACLSADVRWVSNALQMISERVGSDAAFKLVNRRECATRITPLMLCLSGIKLRDMARKGDAVLPGFPIKGDGVGIAAVLLKYGARPHAKDFVGKTIVHYGAGSHATKETIKVVALAAAEYPSSAEVPIADIPDRFGSVAVHEAVMGERSDCITFLVKQLGAQLNISDLDGCNTCETPGLGLRYPEVAAALSNGATVRMRYETKSEERDRRRCGRCGAASSLQTPMQACGKCVPDTSAVVWYCGRECQLADWPQHKTHCRAVRKRVAAAWIQLDAPLPLQVERAFQASTLTKMLAWMLRLVHLLLEFLGLRIITAGQRPAQSHATHFLASWSDGGFQSSQATLPSLTSFRLPAGVKFAEEFWLKVQILPSSSDPDIAAKVAKETGSANSHLCYDESKTLVFSISHGQPAYAELAALVAKHGAMQGRKAHVIARVDEGDKLFVNTERVSIKKW